MWLWSCLNSLSSHWLPVFFFFSLISINKSNNNPDRTSIQLFINIQDAGGGQQPDTVGVQYTRIHTHTRAKSHAHTHSTTYSVSLNPCSESCFHRNIWAGALFFFQTTVYYWSFLSFCVLPWCVFQCCWLRFPILINTTKTGKTLH